jgi:hypothetical protein
MEARISIRLAITFSQHITIKSKRTRQGEPNIKVVMCAFLGTTYLKDKNADR